MGGGTKENLMLKNIFCWVLGEHLDNMCPYHTCVEREIINAKKNCISLEDEDAVSELSCWYGT